MSPSIYKILGYTVEEIYKDPLIFFNADKEGREKLKKVISGDFDYSQLVIVRRYKKDGSTIYLQGRMTPIYDYSGKITAIQGVARDITSQKMSEEELIEVNDFNSRLLDNSSNPIAIINPDYSVRFINPSFQKLTGFSKTEIIGVKPPFPWWDQSKISYFTEIFKKLTSGEENNLEICFKTKSNRNAWVIINCSRLYRKGEIISYLVVLTDITKQRKTNEKLRFLSFHDKLTGLYNRAYFEEELKRISSSRMLPFSIIIGDINNLKLINDAFGHFKGDYFIKKAAGIIKKNCRREDIIARWGGDEFAIILPSTDLQTAQNIIERIKNSCIKEKKEEFFLGISLGASIKNSLDKDAAEVIIEAEHEMYEDKITGSSNSSGSAVSIIERMLREKRFHNIDYISRISKLAKIFALHLNLDKIATQDLILLAKLHNIGNIALPEKIFKKDGSLDDADWKEIMRHPEIGSKIVMNSPSAAHISQSILSHHEWYNGKGYPRGLAGSKIPLICRILEIIIAYDVMVNGSNYKKNISSQEAVCELKKFSGQQFDPGLVEKFLEII